MKAAKLVGIKRHEIIDVQIPVAGAEEVVVKVHVCGFCASELHAWESGVYTGNDYMGHEVVGRVTEVGERVTDVKVGDRVTGYILNGFAEYAKAHMSLVTKVPDGLCDKEAIGEPLGCLVSGAGRTAVEYGDRVAVIGLGYMGLGFMQLMKAKGAACIVGLDVRDDALKNALKFGADLTMDSRKVTDVMKVTEYGVNMDGGYDIAVEVSGSQPGLTLAGEMTKVHGVLSCVGFHQGGNRSVDMELWNWKAITVVNAHERRDPVMMDSIKKGLKLIEAGNINMKDLITHEFTLEDVDKGFSALEEKPEGYIKGIVRMV